jgi:hypothetical protein
MGAMSNHFGKGTMSRLQKSLVSDEEIDYQGKGALGTQELA